MKLKYPVSILAAGALSILCLAAVSGASHLVVHEWGTFTSFQGGDGKLMSWQPLQTSKLPAFVYNWQNLGFKPASGHLPDFVGGKFSIFALQRLETPVVYFYSDHKESIDVKVNFPEGWITEWYPRADFVTCAQQHAFICWSNLTLLPSAKNTHAAIKGDHYFAARETDSEYVRAQNDVDKFLFYRGAGNFKTPLLVTMNSDATVTVSNTGRETLSQLFLLQVKDGAGDFALVPELKPGEHKSVAVPSPSKYLAGSALSKKISTAMARGLEKSGLYAKEADAMVHTWDDSWFQENGTRVLYVLPRTWTDLTLPMTLSSTPKELVRVMVGRAEILTPGAERTLTQQLIDAKQGEPTASALAQSSLKSLGRFATPALQKALNDAKLKPEELTKIYGLLRPSSSFE